MTNEKNRKRAIRKLPKVTDSVAFGSCCDPKLTFRNYRNLPKVTDEPGVRSSETYRHPLRGSEFRNGPGRKTEKRSITT